MRKSTFPFEAVSPATPKQRQLLDRHPLFFRAARYPATHPSNLGLWGIACGPGWYSIIESAASTIEAELHKQLQKIKTAEDLISVERKLQHIPPDTYIDDIAHEYQPAALIPYCSEISQQQGKLQIFITAGYLEDGQAWRRIRDTANAAERLAKCLCELCGNKAQSSLLWRDRVYCNQCIPNAKR